MKITILGGGVSGISTAYHLAELGHNVTVLERQPESALETSFANGGVVGATQIEPWAKAGLPLKILQWLGKDNAPLLFHPSQIPHMWRWGLLFLRNCTEERFRKGSAISWRLTHYSAQSFAALRARAGISYDLNTSGALKIYLDQQSLDQTLATFEALRTTGAEFEVLDVAGCVRKEPALRPNAHTLVGGIYFPGEEVGDCRKFTLALAQHCAARGVTLKYGVTIKGFARSGDRIEAVETDHGSFTADRFVAAAASHTPLLLRSLGIYVPICPVKGVTVTVPVDGWEEPVRGGVIDYSRLFGLMRIGDRLRISGSAEITGYDKVPSAARCQALIDNVLQLFPDFAKCLAAGPPKLWAGLRGNSPDGPPILGRTPITNLFINAGHGPQGWSTSCGSARVVADIVSDRTPEIDLSGLTLDRF